MAIRLRGDSRGKIFYTKRHKGIEEMQLFSVINKFARILSKHQKRRIIQLVLVMIVGGFLEMLSVSLVLPLIEVILKPQEAMPNTYISNILMSFGLNTSKSFLVILAFSMAILYIVKNVYLMLEYYCQYRFVFGNMFSLQRQLLSAFLNRPYEYYLSVESGEIIRVIGDDVMQSFVLLMDILSFFTELIVSLSLTVTVFIISPIITIGMACLLLLLVVLINIVLRPRLKEAGKSYQSSLAKMNMWLIQSIQGIKEIRVMGREEYFQKQFDKYGKDRVTALQKKNLLSIMPKYVIEAISMSVLFACIGIVTYHDGLLVGLIPTFSAIAMALLRLLPSISRMSNGLAGISYYEPMLDRLIVDLEDVKKTADESVQKNIRNNEKSESIINHSMHDIELKNVVFRYPGSDSYVLDNAEMKISIGESIGIVGTTGAGKTTVVDIILGLLYPEKGGVYVDGINIQQDLSGWISQIGYIPQMIFMLDDTIRANVAFGVGADEIAEDKVWIALREAALEDFVRGLPEGLDTKIGERGIRLSGGQRQRIGIARALYLDAPILIFDEATSALDNETEKVIMESINQLKNNRTIIIIAHRLTTIKNCDHVFRVSEGQIVRER